MKTVLYCLGNLGMHNANDTPQLRPHACRLSGMRQYLTTASGLNLRCRYIRQARTINNLEIVQLQWLRMIQIMSLTLLGSEIVRELEALMEGICDERAAQYQQQYTYAVHRDRAPLYQSKQHRQKLRSTEIHKQGVGIF